MEGKGISGYKNTHDVCDIKLTVNSPELEQTEINIENN